MGNAKYIGRVGALAVALGIGTAVASTPWAADADTPADSPSASDSSASDASSSDADSTSTNDSKPATSENDSDDDDASDASGGDEATGEEPATDTDTSTTSETPNPAGEEPVDAEPAPDPEPSEPEQPVAGTEPTDNDGARSARPVTVDPPRSALAASSIAAQVHLQEPVSPTASVDTASTPSATVTFSTAESVVVDAPAIPAPVAPAPVSGVVSGLLAWVGLGPSASGGPVSPAPASPGLVLASAFARRELNQALAQQAPTTSLATVQTSQTTGLLGGLLGGVLGIVFNRTPTTDYDPDENIQAPGGVVTGDLNAADADGDPLSFTVTDAPDKGSVVVNPDGTFVYTPSAQLAATGGTDVFKVKVADQGLHFHGLFGSHSTTATVAVTVAPIYRVIDTINVGDGPTDVMVSPDGTKVYTANAFGDSVSAIDVATGTVTNIPVGDAPNGLTMGVSANNPIVFVAVTNLNDDNYTVIDPATNAVIGTSPDIGDGPVGIASSPDGITGYVANHLDDTVAVLHFTGITTIAVGDGPSYVAVSPNGNTLYVTNSFDDTVSVIDTVSKTVTATIAVGDGPRDVAFSPNGSRVYVTNGASDTVSVIDTATNTVTATIPVGDGPGGVAISPDGTRAYVTNQFDGAVSVIDTTTNTVIGTIPVGGDPAFVTVSPDGAYAYVTNFGDDTVSVIRL